MIILQAVFFMMSLAATLFGYTLEDSKLNKPKEDDKLNKPKEDDKLKTTTRWMTVIRVVAVVSFLCTFIITMYISYQQKEYQSNIETRLDCLEKQMKCVPKDKK